MRYTVKCAALVAIAFGMVSGVVLAGDALAAEPAEFETDGLTDADAVFEAANEDAVGTDVLSLTDEPQGEGGDAGADEAMFACDTAIPDVSTDGPDLTKVALTLDETLGAEGTDAVEPSSGEGGPDEISAGAAHDGDTPANFLEVEHGFDGLVHGTEAADLTPVVQGDAADSSVCDNEDAAGQATATVPNPSVVAADAQSLDANAAPAAPEECLALRPEVGERLSAELLTDQPTGQNGWVTTDGTTSTASR